MTKRFTEEEAELATLCEDFAAELERRQHKETGLRCPAPDPSAMSRRAQQKENDDASATDETVPFVGIHPRTQRKRCRFEFAPGAESDLFSSSDEEDDLSVDASTPTSDIIPERKFVKPMDLDIPMLDFAKLSSVPSPRTGGPGTLLSPRASPPRDSPSSSNISKPDCAKYHSIQGSPRSAFVKPNSA